MIGRDMVKAVAGKEMTISDVYVTGKTGGKSGDFVRDEKNSNVPAETQEN